MKNNTLFTWVFVHVAALTFAQSKLLVVNDKLSPAGSAQIKGIIGNKLDAAYQNRILAQDINRLVDPFKTRVEERCWQTEFWGKWFTSAVLAYRYRPEPKLKAILDEAVNGLIQTQTPDGYIGNYSTAKSLEQWDIWGRKYSMLGLIAYYDITKDNKSLTAAQKLADHLIKELGDKKVMIAFKGNHRGMAASSVMEPICQLYVRTGQKKYLDFAEEIVREWELPDGPQLLSKANNDVDVAKRFPKPKSWWGYEQGQKAYEMMSCYEGLLELYRLTGKPAYRKAVEKVWENIQQTEINVVGSGASAECWFGGKKLQTIPTKHYQETCVTATWIKLSQQLLRLTGEAKYADAIELAYYNALLGSMKPDGSSWTKYSPLAGIRQEGEDQCKMGTNCCIASGPRGLFTLPLTAVMQEKTGVLVNFFVEGTSHLQSPTGQAIEVIQQTTYPVEGQIRIKLALPKAETMTVKLRIPAWSKQNTLTVNGEVIMGIESGKYLTVNRLWKPTDEVVLSLDMRGRLIRVSEPNQQVAIMRGPLVLSRDNRLGGVDVDEIITPVADKDDYIKIELVEKEPNKSEILAERDDIWLRFNVPFVVDGLEGKPVNIMLCDYASAGNTWEQGSRFRVWLPQLYDPEKGK